MVPVFVHGPAGLPMSTQRDEIYKAYFLVIIDHINPAALATRVLAPTSTHEV